MMSIYGGSFVFVFEEERNFFIAKPVIIPASKPIKIGTALDFIFSILTISTCPAIH